MAGCGKATSWLCAQNRLPSRDREGAVALTLTRWLWLLVLCQAGYGAQFHHIHLNTTDRAAAVKFYASRFDCQASVYQGEPAIWTQKSWILFTPVTAAPVSEITSAIWHFGWGAEDMPIEYQRQLSLGTRFETPITDITTLVGGSRPFFYAYVDGPDHSLIELNTANHHQFGHIHLFSDDPIAAGEWYVKYLGVTKRAAGAKSRLYNGFAVAPFSSLSSGNVNIIIFPHEYLKTSQPFESTKGHVVDHLAFSVDRIAPVLEGMRKDGIRVVEAGATSAMIEGPDKVLIELVEGEAAQEPVAAPAQATTNIATWGANHAGKPVPEYVHGDECLFCHRFDIGPGWQKNAHGLAIRQKEDAPELAKFAASVTDTEYFMGSRHHIRLLKKDGYGKFAIWEEKPAAWNRTKFASRCAGCHTTGVDSKTATFTGVGIDCYTCHGDVSLDHTKDTSLILLSKKRHTEPLVVMSICAQCHLRGGASRSTGLPWANNFIPGDNLFQDYNADFSKADDASMNAGDRHVWQNVRDVVLNGSETTCLSCHRLHANSQQKHRLVLTQAICTDCHNETGPKRAIKDYVVASDLCEYGPTPRGSKSP